MDHPQDLLLAKADELCQSPAFRDVVWRCCGYQAAAVDISRLNTHIHRNDQMLLHSLNYFQEVNWSLSQYFNIALQQHHAVQQLLRLMFITGFAPFPTFRGYGRLLRFLTLSVPPPDLGRDPAGRARLRGRGWRPRTVSNVNPDRSGRAGSSISSGRHRSFHCPAFVPGWLTRLTSYSSLRRVVFQRPRRVSSATGDFDAARWIPFQSSERE
jgi:hypothetical protein